jgi:SET domain-containing protein
MDLVRDKLNHNSINQYKIEERSIVARRIISSGNRLIRLVKIMQAETLTLPENLKRLRQEIYKFTKDDSFKESQSMGDIMQASFNFVRLHYEKVDMHDLF